MSIRKIQQKLREDTIKFALEVAKIYIDNTFDEHMEKCVHNGPCNAGGRADGICEACESQRLFTKAIADIERLK